MANLEKLLKTNAMSNLDLKALAQILQSKGRKGDTILAHITPKEAEELMEEGGAGTINPATGLPEFYEDYGADSYMAGYNYEAPSYQAAPDYTPTTSLSSSSDYYTGGGYSPDDYTPMYTAGRPESNYGGDFTAGDYLPSASTGYGDGYSFTDFTGRAGGEGTATPLYQGAQAEQAAMQRAASPELAATGKEGPGLATQALEKLKSVTGLSEETLKKLGLAGAVGLSGLVTGRAARKEGQAAKKEMEALAAPYRTRGAELTNAAMRGELTPQNQQAVQAAQARLAQDIQGRGGAGTQQAQMQVENLRQQMLAQQYDLGLKISSIADNVALGAIRTGMQADQAINQANQDFFTQMAQILGGMPSATGASPQIVIRR